MDDITLPEIESMTRYETNVPLSGCKLIMQTSPSREGLQKKSLEQLN